MDDATGNRQMALSLASHDEQMQGDFGADTILARARRYLAFLDGSEPESRKRMPPLPAARAGFVAD